MATLEMIEPAAVEELAVEVVASGVRREEEQEAAEFIARQVLDRGATFFDG